MFNRNLLSGLVLMAAVGEGSTGGGSVGEAAAPTAIVNGKEFSFFFKTEKLKDDGGAVIGDGRKHPTVTAVLPVSQPLDIIEAFSFLGETEKSADGKTEVLTKRAKTATLILETIQDLHYQAARGQINDWLEKTPSGTFTATNFDLSKLTLEYIASLDKGSRGAWAPSEDDLKVFNEDYTMIFVQEVRYDPKRVKVHCDQFTKGFVKIKNDKIALGKMGEFLTIYASKTANMESNEQTYAWLLARIKKYEKAEEKNFADAL